MKLFRRYLSSIARINGLGKCLWYFYPGMLQDSPDKWWADFGCRHAPHEGIDICFYKNDSKGILPIAHDTLIPAMTGGYVLNIAKDLLGHTLAVSPDPSGGLPENFVFVYSHLDIPGEIKPGSRIEEGQVIARVYDTRQNQSKLLSHLHLSCVELPNFTPGEHLNWDLFACRSRVNLINPVFI